MYYARLEILISMELYYNISNTNTMNVGKMEKSPWYMGRTKETVQYPN